MSHENSKTVQIKDKFYNMPSKFGKHELSEAQIKMLIKISKYRKLNIILNYDYDDQLLLGN